METVTATLAEETACCTALHLMRKTETAIAAAAAVTAAAAEATEDCK
jgi:hypothetical protein